MEIILLEKQLVEVTYEIDESNLNQEEKEILKNNSDSQKIIKICEKYGKIYYSNDIGEREKIGYVGVTF